MKQIIQFMTIFMSLFVIPFVLVWTAWLLTGFSFSPKDVFGDMVFWFLGIMYWLSCLVATGAIIDGKHQKIRESGSF